MLPVDLPRVLDLLDAMKGKIFLEGIFQNFASADDPGGAQTEAQTRIFLEGRTGSSRARVTIRP